MVLLVGKTGMKFCAGLASHTISGGVWAVVLRVTETGRVAKGRWGMTTQGPMDRRSWLDGSPLRRASDIVLGGTLVVAGTAASATLAGTPFKSWDWLIGGSLLVVGVVLLVRGSLRARGQPDPWSVRVLAIIAAAIAGAILAASQWGPYLMLRFGPSEYAALIAIVLAVAIALARVSRMRAVGMALLGLLLATVGTDLSTGNPRLTMGLNELADGIALVVMELGLIIVADGAICILSPTLFLATYGRHLAGWVSPRVPTAMGFGMRIVAVLAIAAACFYVFRLNSSSWEIRELLVLGAFGGACKVFGWNRLVLILGFAYGPLLEENVRRTLLISRGDPAIFLWSPYSATLLLLSCGILAVAALASTRHALFPKPPRHVEGSSCRS